MVQLDASLVRGSHGLATDPQDGAVCVAETPVADMREVKRSVLGLIRS